MSGVKPSHRALLAWYDQVKRDLPWRRNSEAYGVWISETMLQQTRVETVIDYWTRFMAAFPSVRSLAEAQESEVLALWSGLGYYRRARALHAAAQVVLREHGGKMPSTKAELLALPGIGPYTSGAVASIAFGEVASVVDGNVARVFARWFGLEQRIGSSELNRVLWSLADEWVCKPRPGDWNQALMELGATHCKPQKPECDVCPASSWCSAKLEGRTAELPVPKLKPAVIEVELETLVVLRGKRLLLQQRESAPTSKGSKTVRMAGLWEFPTREVGSSCSDPAVVLDQLNGASGTLFPHQWPVPLEAEPGPALGKLRHSITKHRITALVRAAGLPVGWKPTARLAWHQRAEIEQLPLTGMTKKILRNLDSWL